MYRVQDEVSLLRASLQGDTGAWGEIISRYKDAVFGLCLGFMRNRADAEDISHDAFIRAYINLRRYDLERRPISAATNSAIAAITHPQNNLRRFEEGQTRQSWLLLKIDKRGFARRLPSCHTVIERHLCFGSTTSSPIKRYRTSFRSLKERLKRAFIEGRPCLKICLRKERDPA